MRVALVCPYSLDAPGGVATHVIGLATWLAEQGHGVTVIAPGVQPRSVPDGVTLHLLGPAHNFRFNGSVAQLAVRRSQSRAAVHVAGQADVVHVHEPLTPGIAFAVARQCSPLVVTHHASFDVGTVLAWSLRRRSASVRAAEAIAVSRAAQATAHRATGGQPVIIGNGLLMPSPPSAREGWRGGQRPRVAFLGRLEEPRKGFAVFRSMSMQAPQHGIDAEFVALGPGKVEPGPVLLMGPVDDTTRDRALAQVDVLIAPNLMGESFGLVLVEALAAGCAVVCSDLPGFRDVLDAAGTGSLFPVGDVSSALSALRAALEDPPDPATLHRAAGRWGWDALGPQILARYEAALEEHGNSHGLGLRA
ncbi:MAG: glycosyltransferase family 4 protein [Propionibacteriaceae bacterium]|nr:glycosyltransferase family 4 protein [Propionibacteriaceae bacterium]